MKETLNNILLDLILILILTIGTMLLWNWLMPMIFGLIKLNFWQSLGLMMLCSILFKAHPINDN